MPWVVKLVKAPKPFYYASDYFPRKVHYKKEANELKESVERFGGEVKIEEDKKKKK